METIFVLLPLALIIAAIAVGLFIWAARTGQFDDLDTPAVRILFDDDEPRPHAARDPAAPVRRSFSGGGDKEGSSMNLRSRTVRIIVLLVALAATGSLAYALSNARKGYAPRQPILFRHTRMAGVPVWQTNEKGDRVNVGGFGIPCVYCHTMPYKGRHSTVPSTAVCINCHSTVGLNKEWVLKMKEYWDRGEPIHWVKVYDLPDFVYYDHAAHVNARDEQGKPLLPLTDEQGKPMVVCQNCHGKVEEMEIVAVQHAFNMQWCLNCHRKPEMKTSTDCVTCHR